MVAVSDGVDTLARTTYKMEALQASSLPQRCAHDDDVSLLPCRFSGIRTGIPVD